MKGIIRIIIIVIVILITVIVKRNDIYNVYKINQIKKDFVNILNGNFNERTNENTKKSYIRIQKSCGELNHNNVTELINVYIKSVINGINMYIENNKEVVVNKNWEYKEINKYKNVEIGKDIWMKYYVIDYAVGERFTSYDVKNYEDGTFRDVLVKKLKNCLDYKEQGNTIEWYINSIEDKRIELPYNCYIDYKAYHRDDNKKFKRAIDVRFSKTFKLKNTLENIIVVYETNSGCVSENEVYLFYNNYNGKEYYDIDILNVLTLGADTKAECILNSHTLDRWTEEARVEFFEKYPIIN